MPVNRLMRFAALCRACGVTISPSESVAFANDLADVPFDDGAVLEEATVACLAKDSGSEVIVRRLFRLFFTGYPAAAKEESGDEYVDSQLMRGLQEAMASGRLSFDTETPVGTAEAAGEIEPGPRTEGDMADQGSHDPIGEPSACTQATRVRRPQMLDQAELELELAGLGHGRLSGTNLELIIGLLEDLSEVQNAAHGEESAQPEDVPGNPESTVKQKDDGEPLSDRKGGGEEPGSSAPRFTMPLSFEAAQVLAAASVQESAMGHIEASVAGRLAGLMNPEQGRSFLQEYNVALEDTGLADRERQRLLEGLEYAAGKLLFEDRITPEEFAAYGALFSEHVEAQATTARTGAETHLKDVHALTGLLTRYRSDAQLLRLIVSRLSAALERLASRRMPIYAKSFGGKLDVRKTVRRSLQYDGVPMEFIYREKTLWEDILLVLDTSGSQFWWTASAMLFARALERTTRRLRIYSFTSDIQDVTDYVPWPEKFVQHLVDFAGYSNYETSFQQLLSRAPISSCTTLMIVGDCRDYQGSWKRGGPGKYGPRVGPASAKLMSKLVARCRRVIILNPEEEAKWAVDDSAAPDYERSGATVRYVSSPLNLAEQLMRV